MVALVLVRWVRIMEKAFCRQITFYVTVCDTASAEPFPDNQVLTLSNRRQARS